MFKGSHVAVSDARLLLGDATRSCHYYPINLDARERTLTFTQIDRQGYRDAAFLVPRQAKMGPRQYAFNIDDLLHQNRSSPASLASPHFILISAFCCSTLLARYFDEIDGCLVLREPSILGQLAILRTKPEFAAHGITNDPALWTQLWLEWAQLTLSLLARSFDTDRRVVIKAADVCNAIGDTLLEHHNQAKLLLLSIDFRTFVLSVLKSESRRAWMRQRARFWRRESQRTGILADLHLQKMDDATKSAYLWLMSQLYWQELKRSSPSSVQFLNGEIVSSNPARALQVATRFFGVKVSADRLAQISASTVSEHHAKLPDRAYTAQKRDEERANWEQKFGSDADRARVWAEAVCGAAVVDVLDREVASAC